ncbi:MAG: nucleotidyltransferase family protein [Deltaproteobacteria bacterium]
MPTRAEAGNGARYGKRMVTMNQDAERLILLLAGNATIGALTESEWEDLIDYARKSSVAQVLFVYLKSQSLSIPPVAAERIRNIYLASAVRNTKLFHELKNILLAFQTAGVTAVPLKGAWLAEKVYSNIALRGMGDVDLWVQRDQLDEARRVMVSLGYASRSKSDRPQELQDALTGETQMFKTGAPMVELHWNLFPGEWLRHTAFIDEQEIWQRTLPLQGENVRQLSPEDAIIHISVHFAVNHQMSMPGLRTLLDLYCARQKLNIDWVTVAERAKAWRVSTATWLVLRMLAELFGDPERKLPLQELRPSTLRRKILERFISPRIFLEGIDISSGPKRFLFLLALVDRPADAFYLSWRALMPDRTWLTLRYGLQAAPAWRVGLQRLLHPLRIAWKRKI